MFFLVAVISLHIFSVLMSLVAFCLFFIMLQEECKEDENAEPLLADMSTFTAALLTKDEPLAKGKKDTSRCSKMSEAH